MVDPPAKTQAAEEPWRQKASALYASIDHPSYGCAQSDLLWYSLDEWYIDYFVTTRRQCRRTLPDTFLEVVVAKCSAELPEPVHQHQVAALALHHGENERALVGRQCHANPERFVQMDERRA